MKGRWNIIGKMTVDIIRLDDAQKTAGEVGHFLAEARSILMSYIRKKENLRYTDYNDMVLEAAKKSEFLTEKLRRLILDITFDLEKYDAYKLDLVYIHGIKINYEQEILEVSMPMLIPHRKHKFTDYLYKPLHTAFQQWCTEQIDLDSVIPEFHKCTVCFLHLYDENLPISRVRDHDNIEEKHVLDVIANFCLKSDNGLQVDTYHFTRMGKKDRTKIYIMDTQKFPDWMIEKSI